MSQPIATWNPQRMLWETATLSLFCEDSEPYSETFATSGMTRNGSLFPLPASEPPTSVNECSSSQLMPTPTTQPQTGNGHARNLGKEVQLLPTPVVTDAKGARNATANRSEGSAHHSGETLTDAVTLLPTPRVSAERTSRGAAVRRDSMAAPSLEQAIEIASGQLPREANSWDELPPSWHP